MPRHEDPYNRDTDSPVTGSGSHKLSAYELPVCNQDQDRRNFPGYHKSVPGDELMDLVSHEGTTETRGGKGVNPAYDPKTDTRYLPRRFSPEGNTKGAK
jgi:hypothetical protein